MQMSTENQNVVHTKQGFGRVILELVQPNVRSLRVSLWPDEASALAASLDDFAADVKLCREGAK